MVKIGILKNIFFEKFSFGEDLLILFLLIFSALSLFFVNFTNFLIILISLIFTYFLFLYFTYDVRQVSKKSLKESKKLEVYGLNSFLNLFFFEYVAILGYSFPFKGKGQIFALILITSIFLFVMFYYFTILWVIYFFKKNSVVIFEKTSFNIFLVLLTPLIFYIVIYFFKRNHFTFFLWLYFVLMLLLNYLVLILLKVKGERIREVDGEVLRRIFKEGLIKGDFLKRDDSYIVFFTFLLIIFYLGYVLIFKFHSKFYSYLYFTNLIFFIYLNFLREKKVLLIVNKLGRVLKSRKELKSLHVLLFLSFLFFGARGKNINFLINVFLLFIFIFYMFEISLKILSTLDGKFYRTLKTFINLYTLVLLALVVNFHKGSNYHLFLLFSTIPFLIVFEISLYMVRKFLKKKVFEKRSGN